MRTFAAFRGMRGFQKPLILVLINTFMIDKKTIQTAVEEWLQKGDYFLVDVEMNPDGRIVIEIDCADGVWIEDCADLSRHLQEQLGDELGDYELEVGSAGIGQPFKVVQQYRNHIGKEVEVLQQDGIKQKGMLKSVSEDGTLIHVVDSAPGATFERKNRFKTKGHIYYQLEDGSFQEAKTIDQLPGIRWFFETGDYGGMEYWLDLNYALHYHKHSGMRLIRKPWLQADTGSGLKTVSLDYIGTAVSRVNDGGEELVRVSTKDLSWSTDGADGPQIAVVTNKNGAKLLDGNGYPRSILRKSGIYPIPRPPMPVLIREETGALFRPRADLEIRLRIRETLVRENRRSAITRTPAVILKT